MISRISWAVLSTATLLIAQERAIDVKRSTITVHVGKAGLFSVAGHEHWVEAPISSGLVNESGPKTHHDAIVDRLRARVRTLEPAGVAGDFLARLATDADATDGLEATGTLTLHGATKPISFAVARSGDAYVGRTTLRQTDFGIKPITAAGGTVKVKNELEIEFRILTLSE